MNKFGLTSIFLILFGKENVNESDRDVREREMSVGEKSFLRLSSLV